MTWSVSSISPVIVGKDSAVDEYALPSSIRLLNISVEEYNYLTKSVFTSLTGMA